MHVFERVLVDGTLSALIISGKPTDEDLVDSWNAMLLEYTEMLGDFEYKVYLQTFKEVELLRVNYECVGLLTNALRSFYSPYFIQELNLLLRMNLRLNAEDPESYYAELDKCDRRAKGIKLRLQLKEAELDVLRKKINSKEGEKVDKNYFTRVLVMLSQHNSFMVTKDIMVNVYCEMIKQYAEYVEAHKQRPKKRYK